MSSSSNALETAARIGYGARGVIYLVIGGLAVLAAAGMGGGSSDSEGALHALMGQPWGYVVVFGLGCGLLCYAGWRFLQGALDADRHGTSARALAIRAGLLVSAVTHLLLAGLAFGLVLGFGSSSDNAGAIKWLMSQPYGRYLVAAAGLCILGAGIAQIWKGAAGTYAKRMNLDGDGRAWLKPVCAAGLVARGIVFAIIAFLTLYAAWRVAPDQAGGLNAALRWISGLPAGSALYAIIAVGLVAFGLYSLAEAMWRRIGKV